MSFSYKDMKILTTILTAILLLLNMTPFCPTAIYAEERNSSFLASKAWQASRAGDYERAHYFADECIRLYTKEARRQHQGLKAYPEGELPEVMKDYWALNDVAAAHFVKGLAYKDLGQIEEAEEQFELIIKEYRFALVWDNAGWWWSPAEGAQDWLLKFKPNRRKLIYEYRRQY